MDIQSRVVIGGYWHGVGTVAGWDVLKWGGGLRLPEPGAHVHDPGDYGLAVYLTDCKPKAETYAVPLLDTKGYRALVQVQVELENALVFDWREGTAIDPEHPTNVQTDFFEALFGDPIHGSPEERRRVAEKWRDGMLARGYDGVVVLRRGESELAVYLPEKSIKGIHLEPGI